MLSMRSAKEFRVLSKLNLIKCRFFCDQDSLTNSSTAVFETVDEHIQPVDEKLYYASSTTAPRPLDTNTTWIWESDLGSTGAGEAVSEVPKAEILSGLHELFHLRELV